MKELDESIKLVLSRLPEDYRDVALRLKTHGDWRNIELVLHAIRERILDKGKQTGDGGLFHVLEGFDSVFLILDKISGTFQKRAQIEKQIFDVQKKEEAA